MPVGDLPAAGASAAPRHENRLFAAFTVIALPVILLLLPDRYHMLPSVVPVVAGLALAITMVVAGRYPEIVFWRRAERWTAAIVLPFVTLVELLMLGVLLRDMARAHSSLSGLTLLTTSVGLWATNVLVFALAYWQLDRGGPAGREDGFDGRTDFSFPRGEPEDRVPADWQPTFADYLSLSFNTSAAFSPTDVLPLTRRAKMMMMTQSVISLVIVIAVGARAINILGS